jgi:hypothetical protein
MNMLLRKYTNSGAILLLLVFWVLADTAVSQETPTPTPAPTPTEQQRTLQSQIDTLKLQKEREELLKAIRDAQPQPTSTPLSGDATGVKDLKMEINLQTYKSVRRVTDRIACDIQNNVKNPVPKTYVFYKAEIYQAWINYRAAEPLLKAQLGTMKSDYTILLSQYDTLLLPSSEASLIGGLSIATLGLRSLADLLAMFRTDVDFTYSTVTVNDAALKALMANSLRRPEPCKEEKKDVFNRVYSRPVAEMAFYDPDLFYPVTDANGELMRLLSELLALKKTALVKILESELPTSRIEMTKKEIEALDKALTGLKENIAGKKLEEGQLKAAIAKASAAKKPPLKVKLAAIAAELGKLDEELAEAKGAKVQAAGKLGRLETAIGRLKQLNTEFDQFYTALNTRDTATQTSPLMQFIKVEALDNILKTASSNAYWLEIRSIDAGGASRVRKNLFRYFYEPDISFNGASIIEFTVSDANGRVLISNVNSAVQNYRKSSNVTKENEEGNKER